MKESRFQGDPGLTRSIRTVTDGIAERLADGAPSVYLYGSAALGDFRLGWSDIDILVLTERRIAPEQAEGLLRLRRALTAREPENPYYRLIGCEALKDSYVRLRYEVLREHIDLSATGKGGEKA